MPPYNTRKHNLHKAIKQLLLHLLLLLSVCACLLHDQKASLKAVMEVESVKCDCCGLREDCTEDYISSVKANFDGKWLCGLCSEAVRDELSKGRRRGSGVEEAIKAHMSFCRKFKSNPAVRVADGMRQMLRRRSGDLSKPSSAVTPKRPSGRTASASQVGDESSVSFY